VPLALSNASEPLNGLKCLTLVYLTIGMHKSEGVYKAINALPVPAEDSTSIKLIGIAKRAVTIESKALEP